MKIVIEVKGGTVQAVRSTGDVKIVILDYDNEEVSGGYYEPDNIFSNEEMEKYIEQEVELHNAKNIQP